jgi:DNA-binding HxlR family transcriptional regulator
VAARNYGQYCGVAAALGLVGERWALLIIRDLLVGPRRYSDLKQGLPRIPTNILSTRLKELQAGGIVRRLPLAHGLAYDLTDYGRGLEGVILALGRWGFQAMGDPAAGDIITADSMTIALRTAFAADAAGAVPATVYEAHLADFILTLRVDDSGLTVTRGTAAAPDLAFAAGPGIRRIISGELTPGAAIAEEVVRVLDGDPALLGRFAQTFHLETNPVAVATG